VKRRRLIRIPLQNLQDRKLAFLNGSVDRRTVSPDHSQNAASRYVVQAGSIIPVRWSPGSGRTCPVGNALAQCICGRETKTRSIASMELSSPGRLENESLPALDAEASTGVLPIRY
jgi:hypothetical protein